MTWQAELDRFAEQGRAQLKDFRPLASPDDVAAHQAAFLSACGKKAKKAAWYTGFGLVGIALLNIALLLGLFAGAVFIVLGALRFYGVI